MSNNADQLIKLLHGSDSQHPISADDLADKMGMTPEAINIMLNQLYAGRVINQALVTKANIERRMVWLTMTATAGKAVITADWRVGKPVPPTPVRREPKQQTPPAAAESNDEVSGRLTTIRERTLARKARHQINHRRTQETTMATKPATKSKSKVQLILEYIGANPNARHTEIMKGCQVSSIDAFLVGYLKREQVIRSEDKRYRLADGLTVTAILAGKTPHGAAAQSKPEPTPAQPAEDTADQPRKAVRIEKDRFKVSFTSEGTLMLFGLMPDMIELDQGETKKLLQLVRPHIDAEAEA